MLQVMIVDDEPKICTLIQQLGDWGRLQLQVVGICHSGDEALEMIRKVHPDIVITDVRMPAMDGLQLVAEAEKEIPDASFIVISGYRQFEYAYGAMQRGVINYLLKPIDQVQLNETLEKACHRIIEKRKTETDLEQLERLQLERKNRLQEVFVQNIINYSYADGTAGLPEGFAGDYYSSIVINVDRADLYSKTPEFLKMSIEQIHRAFDEYASTAILPTEFGIVCLLAYYEQNEIDIHRAMNQLLQLIIALRDVFGEFNLAIGAGSSVRDPNELPGSMQKAFHNERTKLFVGWNRIIDGNPEIQEPDLKNFIALEKRMKSILDILDVSSLALWFKDWIDTHSDENPNVDLVYAEVYDLMNLLKPLSSAEQLERLKTVLLHASNIQELAGNLEKIFREVLEEHLKNRKEEEDRPIRIAKKYVAEHYAENLTLEIIANQVGYSTVYFSTIFSRNNGMGFIEYLTSVRMDIAKNLLKTSRKSIGEVAIAVGYHDDKYFSKLFKKETGISPKAYRRLYE